MPHGRLTVGDLIRILQADLDATAQPRALVDRDVLDALIALAVHPLTT